MRRRLGFVFFLEDSISSLNPGALNPLLEALTKANRESVPIRNETELVGGFASEGDVCSQLFFFAGPMSNPLGLMFGPPK